MVNLPFLALVSKGELRGGVEGLPPQYLVEGDLLVPRHPPPVGGSYGVINERRLNGGTSEGGSTEGRKRKGEGGGALTLKVRRKKEEKGPILHTLHYIWDRAGEEMKVGSIVFSQDANNFTFQPTTFLF